MEPIVPILIIAHRSHNGAASLMADAAALMEKPVDVELLLKMVGSLLAEPEEIHLRPSCSCPHEHWHKPAARGTTPAVATQLPFR